MIAVLGCGPAGLLAAHACVMSGVDRSEIRIYSKVRKSHLYGAQYMGAPIPGIQMGRPTVLTYSLRGTIDQYRNKVYGHTFKGIVSPQDFMGVHQAWDIRAMYDWLWQEYESLMRNVEDINPGWIVGDLPTEYKTIFSSIPKDKLCFNKDIHKFPGQRIWAMGDAPGIQDVAVQSEPNSIVCDGTDIVAWYRMSNVFGYRTIEWADTGVTRPRVAVAVVKPIHNNCDCWRGRLIPIGRYGRWEKGVLVHSVFEQVSDALSALSAR